MKTFFTFLLYLIIILLIGGIVFGISYLLEWPLVESAIVYALILTAWLLFILVRKAIVRFRARSQVLRVINKENAIRDADLGMSPKQLKRNLEKNWAKAQKLLRKSHLKLRGDPMYVLPWYVVFGKPRSGKSTALKNAKLISPAMELSDHHDGSTLNVEWWLYDQAIILDTAGRYAVPDNDHRDRQEWTNLLQMLSRHKQKEPLNGLVLVVSADRLLHDSEEELKAEGQRIRAGMNEMMERLEIQMPVYLMVTKCDLVDQFSNWCQYLPEESLEQVMGYLCTEEVFDINKTLDQAFDKVLGRLKELRLLMMERGDYPDDSLIELPINMEKLRKGLHAFAQTALKDNLYQETPRFRGLYFSSSQQSSQTGADGELVNRGIFLHELFTRVMPPDRGMLSTLPSAERLRRAIKTYGMSISGAVLVTLLVGLTSAFFTDEDSLRKLIDNHPRINVVQQDINLQINALNRLNELYQSVGETEDDWSLPWYGPFIESPHLGRIRRTFVVAFRSDLLERVDADITKIASSDLDSDERAYLVSGLVRRINLLTARLEQNVEGYAALAEIPEQYLRVVDPKVNAESAVLFDFLYQEYLQLEQSTVELNDERLRLQAALESVIASSHGNFEWLVIYTGLQGFAEIKVGDFWNGSRQLVDEPFVPSAYTLEGLEFIEKFLDELTLAGGDSASLAAVKEDFMVFYQRNYLKAWIAFADEFDYGKNKLRGRKEWQSAMESMSTVNSPYFSVMRTIQREVEPVYSEGLFNIRGELDYFAEIQEFVGDESGPDNSKAKKKATKAALKVVGKLGNVGKFVAKATKKGLKAKKKLGGKDQEKLDDQLEEAVKIYQSYKTALKDLAFNGDAVKLSYAETSYAFNNPDTRPSGGDGAGAKAWASVLELQRILGRSKGATRLFWNLYDGPVRLAYEYMQEEAACYLQTTWEDKVLGGLEGVTDDKLGESLVGETGLLWDFTSKDAAPFLQKKLNKGYVSKRLGDVSVEWKPEFVEFINSADSGRNIVAGEYEVTIATLPTGINQSAKISPYATFIDLHCADGVQTLSNYNYSASNTFKWSLSNCGDATLRIEAGQYSLRKLYLGQKGFPKFLEDFQDGRRIFTVSEFPGFESQLRNDGVRAIDVNYQIKGQAPVIKMLKAVPLDPPYDVVSCWAD